MRMLLANKIGIIYGVGGPIQEIPLIEITVADLVRPITNGVTTNFLTAWAAARRMVQQGSASSSR